VLAIRPNVCSILKFVTAWQFKGLIKTAHTSPYLFSGTPENWVMAGLPALSKGGNGGRGRSAFFIDRSIISNAIVDQDRLETNLLQLFAHPQNSEWFSIISIVIF